jgi:hypothetical protein
VASSQSISFEAARELGNEATISLEAEHELRNDAMMMKSESPSPISSRASYFADSESDAANEVGRGGLRMEIPQPKLILLTACVRI